MSARLWSVRSNGLLNSAAPIFWGLLCLACLAFGARAQERREREPNSIYAERRARLAAQAEGPIVLWGFTGKEEASQTYIFEQEENFYYLTGHNEEGAGLLMLPQPKNGEATNGPRETLFLPAKNSQKEKWNGVRMSPSDPGIEARTGFATVKSFDSDFRIAIESLAKTFPNFYTILPYQKELGGYPHEKTVVDWLQLAAPQAKLKDIRAQIGAMRQIKSPGELAFLKEAIDLSLDAHLEAIKLMRPGLYEYQVSAKMVEVHAWGGSEAEAYAPIVGAVPATLQTSHARFLRTANSLRASAKFTTSSLARKTPQSPGSSLVWTSAAKATKTSTRLPITTSTPMEKISTTSRLAPISSTASATTLA